MKKIILLIALLLPLTLLAQEIRDIDIRVVVAKDGSATVTTDWDVTVTSGTEWYIPVGNLGPMKVTSLKVSEDGKTFVDEGFNWDSGRSLEQKKGRSGLVRKTDGVELCWGQGSLGDHKWRTVVKMTGLVQGMTDYDGFNFQFVNTQMVAGPQHVKVTIVNQTSGPEWTSENTRVWAFGFRGSIYVIDGAVVAETRKPMSKRNHVTIMVRFDKGMFAPEVTKNSTFAQMEKKAKKGSSYNILSNTKAWGPYLLGAGVLALILWILGAFATGNIYRKKLFGTRKIEGWCRDVPLNGNLFAAYYVMDGSRRFYLDGEKYSRGLMGAIFLKWMLEGKVSAHRGWSKRNIKLALRNDVEINDPVEADLYEMCLAAAGRDMILTPREFKRWSRWNYEHIKSWPYRARGKGRSYLLRKGYINKKDRGTEEGFGALKEVIEFKNFLKDFTILNQRTIPEVHLWNQYLIYAALFGIADKVSKQMKKLYPTEFAEYSQDHLLDMFAMMALGYLVQKLADAGLRAAATQAARESGEGGSSSVGGGGGHSGGGVGGGSR